MAAGQFLPLPNPLQHFGIEIEVANGYEIDQNDRDMLSQQLRILLTLLDPDAYS